MKTVENQTRRKVSHIDDIEPIDQSDIECMNAVRICLESFGLESRFGLYLMHDHFAMRNDEILLEEKDCERRTAKLSVINATDLGELKRRYRVAETSWNLFSHYSIKSENAIDLEGTIRPESLSVVLKDSAHYTISESDKRCFEQIKRILQEHSKQDRFGVMLHHSRIPLKDGEVLLESHDENERTLYLTPTQPDALHPSLNLLATSWDLSDFSASTSYGTITHYVQGPNGWADHRHRSTHGPV